MELFTEVGGRTGVDCGGFCEFCFYKNVDFNGLEPIGCINCPPNQIGCDYCQEIINRVSIPFKPLSQYLADLNKKFFQLEWDNLSSADLQIIVAGGADLLNYPELYKLISTLKELPISLHLGYTSGKPIKNGLMAEDLISLGVDEVSFSVFATNHEIRRKWMHDETSEESVKGLKVFCENIDLNASAVIIPGVNDGYQLFQTCSDLEDWGAKSLTIRRFANFKNQGLILNEKPLIPGITPHSYEEFQELVQNIANEFSFKVLGYPFYEPENKGPFIIAKEENEKYLENLPDIKAEATIITSKLAAPYLEKIFKRIDGSNLVNMVSVNKDIADLIIHEDLESIDLNEVKNNVIIPSGALVHDKVAAELLSKDGKQKKILRGPYVLTYPYQGEEHLIDKEELIKYELKSFKELIDKINSF